MVKMLKKYGIIIITCVLLVSIVFNIYLFIGRKTDRKEISTRLNNEVCLIKDRNEANNVMLEMVTEKGSISKTDITKLYSNYNEISRSIYYLLEEYNLYSNNGNVINKQTLDTTGTMPDDIYVRINSYILYIKENNEVQNTGDKRAYVLTEEDKKLFKSMYNLSNDVKDYFASLTEKYPIRDTENKLKESMIKDNIWMDVLDNSKKMNEKYSSFTLPVEKK